MILQVHESSSLPHCERVLRQGGLLGLPTETVYGLSADADDAQAVAAIFAAKGRPADHPLIVHVADMDGGLSGARYFAREIPEFALRLMQAFWPGPLTLILPRRDGVAAAAAGGQDSVGLRCPAHPAAQALLRALRHSAQGSVVWGLAAPSANRFGRVSPTTAQHVHSEFNTGRDADDPGALRILDGGPCEVGIESAIVDLSGAVPALLRPGLITAAQIEAALGTALALPGAQSPRAPGMLEKHYAPRTPLMLVAADLIDELARSFVRQGQRVAVLARGARPPLIASLTWIAAPAAPGGYAHDLYANLRQLDAAGCDVMLVEEPPLAIAWVAVRDRLARAAAGAPRHR